MSVPAPEAPVGRGEHPDALAVPKIVDDLTYAFEGVFAEGEVEDAVRAAWAELSSVSRIPTYLPVLTSRLARERLTAAAQADGRIVKVVPELLFVCVHNAGRSQLAAALANHLAPGRVHVRSAGSAPTGGINQLVVQVLAERGIALSEAFPKPLSDDVVRAADVIVTMGCGDACPVLPGRRYEDWAVPDPAGQPIEVVRDIRDELQARVTALLRDLDL